MCEISYSGERGGQNIAIRSKAIGFSFPLPSIPSLCLFSFTESNFIPDSTVLYVQYLAISLSFALLISFSSAAFFSALALLESFS